MSLCERADIIVENFRPGALAAFGLDYESVAARNPKVVYAVHQRLWPARPMALPHGLRAYRSG